MSDNVKEKVRCNGCSQFLSRIYICEHCKKPYHSLCAKFKVLRVRKTCVKCCRACQAALRPPVQPTETEKSKVNSNKRRGSTNSLNNQPILQLNSQIHSQSDPALNRSSEMYSNQGTENDILVELNSKLQCLRQINEQVSKIGGIETTLMSLNTNVQTALNLSIQNRQSISNITAKQQQCDLRIERNEIRINELSQRIEAPTDIPHSSGPPRRPDWDREIAITGLSNEIIGNPIEFLRILSGVLGIDFKEFLIDDIVLLPVVKDKARVLIIKFITKVYRDKWLLAKKEKRDILFSDIMPNAGDSRIFLNERSTAIERRTYREAKEKAKSEGFKYCWMRKGQVYLRKDDKIKPIKYPQEFSQPNLCLVADDATSQGIQQSNDSFVINVEIPSENSGLSSTHDQSKSGAGNVDMSVNPLDFLSQSQLPSQPPVQSYSQPILCHNGSSQQTVSMPLYPSSQPELDSATMRTNVDISNSAGPQFGSQIISRVSIETSPETFNQTNLNNSNQPSAQ